MLERLAERVRWRRLGWVEFVNDMVLCAQVTKCHKLIRKNYTSSQIITIHTYHHSRPPFLTLELLQEMLHLVPFYCKQRTDCLQGF
jgi:hypothetical protein